MINNKRNTYIQWGVPVTWNPATRHRQTPVYEFCASLSYVSMSGSITHFSLTSVTEVNWISLHCDSWSDPQTTAAVPLKQLTGSSIFYRKHTSWNISAPPTKQMDLRCCVFCWKVNCNFSSTQGTVVSLLKPAFYTAIHTASFPKQFKDSPFWTLYHQHPFASSVLGAHVAPIPPPSKWHPWVHEITVIGLDQRSC